jgi:hypothetical protein
MSASISRARVSASDVRKPRYYPGAVRGGAREVGEGKPGNMIRCLASPTRKLGAFLLIMWLCTFVFAASRSMFGNESVSRGLVILAACAIRLLIAGEPRVIRRAIKALCLGGVAVIAEFSILEAIAMRVPAFAEHDPGIGVVAVIFAVYQGGPILLASLILAFVPFEKIGNRVPS